MQHWHIFRKWNERLFQEMHKAYREGRAEKDPSEFWFKGEIGFFDFYIIPLAKKLKECGVFGVSSDEYLNYAIKNRGKLNCLTVMPVWWMFQLLWILHVLLCFLNRNDFAEEWIVKGNEIVEQMLERVPQKEDTPAKAAVVPETAP